MKLGITGGMGGGKTTVCRIFEVYGIPVYYADERAKGLMNADQKLMAQLRAVFGDDIYSNVGELDRKKLGAMIFKDKNLLAKMNQMVHPAVAQDYQAWEARQKSPYSIKEAAITFEIGGATEMDKMILVTAPKEVRIKRVTERNGWSREAIEDRMKNQWPDERKMPLSDFIVFNDEAHSLIKQVADVHNVLLHLAG